MYAKKRAFQFSCATLIIVLTLSAVFARWISVQLALMRPIVWVRYSKVVSDQALKSGRPVVIWLRPDFNLESKQILSLVDTPRVRKAIYESKALTMSMDYSDPLDPVASKLIRETGSHPHHSAICVFHPNGEVSNMSDEDFEEFMFQRLELVIRQKDLRSSKR